MLGAQAAQLLGIDRVYPGERVWLGGMWFYVTGILTSATLAPEIDSSVLVGFPAAEKYLGLDGHPTTIYVRTVTSQTAAVQSVLAATANPEITQRGRRQPALRGAHRPRRRPGRPQRPVPGPGRRVAAGRRGRGGEHHDHLRPRAAVRDRPPPRPRRHQGTHPHPVPGGGDPARAPRGRSPASSWGWSRPPSTPTPSTGPRSSPPWPGQAGWRRRSRSGRSRGCCRRFAPPGYRRPTPCAPSDPGALRPTRSSRAGPQSRSSRGRYGRRTARRPSARSPPRARCGGRADPGRRRLAGRRCDGSHNERAGSTSLLASLTSNATFACSPPHRPGSRPCHARRERGPDAASRVGTDLGRPGGRPRLGERRARRSFGHG